MKRVDLQKDQDYQLIRIETSGLLTQKVAFFWPNQAFLYVAEIASDGRIVKDLEYYDLKYGANLTVFGRMRSLRDKFYFLGNENNTELKFFEAEIVKEKLVVTVSTGIPQNLKDFVISIELSMLFTVSQDGKDCLKYSLKTDFNSTSEECILSAKSITFLESVNHRHIIKAISGDHFQNTSYYYATNKNASFTPTLVHIENVTDSSVQKIHQTPNFIYMVSSSNQYIFPIKKPDQLQTLTPALKNLLKPLGMYFLDTDDLVRNNRLVMLGKDPNSPDIANLHIFGSDFNQSMIDCEFGEIQEKKKFKFDVVTLDGLTQYTLLYFDKQWEEELDFIVTVAVVVVIVMLVICIRCLKRKKTKKRKEDNKEFSCNYLKSNYFRDPNSSVSDIAD
jgi:hypothetical protein